MSTNVFMHLVVYVAFFPFAASMWTDMLVRELCERRTRGSLLRSSILAAIFWPVVLFGVLFVMAVWAFAVTVEFLGDAYSKTTLGRWLAEEVSPPSTPS